MTVLFRSADSTDIHVGAHFAEDQAVAAAYLWADFGGPVLFSAVASAEARWLSVDDKAEIAEALEDAGMEIDASQYGGCADILASCPGAIAALATDYDLISIPETYPSESEAVVVLNPAVLGQTAVIGGIGDLEARIVAAMDAVQWLDECERDEVADEDRTPALLVSLLEAADWEDVEAGDLDLDQKWWTSDLLLQAATP